MARGDFFFPFPEVSSPGLCLLRSLLFVAESQTGKFEKGHKRLIFLCVALSFSVWDRLLRESKFPLTRLLRLLPPPLLFWCVSCSFVVAQVGVRSETCWTGLCSRLVRGV